MNSPHASQVPDLSDAVRDFVRAASTEISTHDEDLLPALTQVLPPGTAVYVAHTPKAKLDDVVRVATKVQSLGFRASPHIVARRLPTRGALRTLLAKLTDGGIDQILLIAGDLEQPVGSFTSTLEVVDSGLLEDSGIERIGVAGHPEGHEAIGREQLLDALRHKQEFGARTGTAVHIVTQFGFDPQGICAWDHALTEAGISLPVHVGIAGPTPLPKLMKFALQCGVGASMRSLLKSSGSAFANLVRPTTTPDAMLLGLVRASRAYRESRIVQPHFYAFGGTISTATWLRAVMDGHFTIQPDGRRFDSKG